MRIISLMTIIFILLGGNSKAEHSKESFFPEEQAQGSSQRKSLSLEQTSSPSSSVGNHQENSWTYIKCMIQYLDEDNEMDEECRTSSLASPSPAGALDYASLSFFFSVTAYLLNRYCLFERFNSHYFFLASSISAYFLANSAYTWRENYLALLQGQGKNLGEKEQERQYTEETPVSYFSDYPDDKNKTISGDESPSLRFATSYEDGYNVPLTPLMQ